MIRSGRTSGQARKAAMERVRIFASQGRSHLAEMEINDLLSGGVPVSEVCKVLNGLPYGIPPDLAPRREALQRSAALLAGGALIGARMRSPRSSGAAGSGSPLPVFSPRHRWPALPMRPSRSARSPGKGCGRSLVPTGASPSPRAGRPTWFPSPG